MLRNRREGFILVTLLGALAMASTVVAVTAAGARTGVGASRNRVAAERAHWRAIACTNIARARMDSMLRAVNTQFARERLNAELHKRFVLADTAAAAPCAIALEAVGSRLDVNGATFDQLRRLVEVAAPESDADGVIAAIAQSRGSTTLDGDTLRVLEEVLPAARFEDDRELRLLPLIAEAPPLSALLGVESGPVSIRFAPAEVLLTLPGMTRSAVEAIVRLRAADSLPNTLDGLLGALAPRAAAVLLSRFPQLSRVAVVDPVAWIVRVSASDGRPPIEATIEMRVSIRTRVIVERERRTW